MSIRKPANANLVRTVGPRPPAIHTRVSHAGGLGRPKDTLQPAIRPPYAPQLVRTASTQVVQRKKRHAKTYVRDHPVVALKVVSYETVSAYVNNPENPTLHRLGLLRSWNTKQKRLHRIPTPGDLIPKEAPTFSPGFDFSNYDSDEDVQLELEAAIEKNQQKKVTLKRKDKEKDVNVSVLPFSALLKISRQMVKRELNLREHLPFVLDLGGQMLEFDTPYGNDIYCYGLEKAGEGYKRGGGSECFNWKNLGDRFDDAAPSKEERRTKIRKIIGVFKGEIPDKLSQDEAEALGAMSCDAMKGVAGTLFYMGEALKVEDPSSKEVFCGKTPKYGPAAFEGRKLAKKKTKALKKTRYMPNQAQTDYLTLNGKALVWIVPDGRCIFGSLAHLKGISTHQAIEDTKQAIQRSDRRVLDVVSRAAEQLGGPGFEGDARRKIFLAIVKNRWADPEVGDYIIHVAAAALEIGVTVLMPDARLVNINGGGPLIVKVTQPLEHYHATRDA